MSDGGKGDSYRKVDPQKFSEGYDRIFGKRTGAEEALEAQREYSKRVRERLDNFATRPVIKAFAEAVAKHGTHPGKVWNVNEDGEVVPADTTAKTGTALAMQGFVGSVHEAYLHGVRVATEVHLSKTCGNCEHWDEDDCEQDNCGACTNSSVINLIDQRIYPAQDFCCNKWEGK